LGNDVVYTIAPPAGDGLVAAAMWRMLQDDRRYRRAGPDERPHLIAETASRAFAARAGWLASGAGDPESILSKDAIAKAMADYSPTAAGRSGGALADGAGGPGDSTGFVVVDSLGGAVACSFTGTVAFGTGAVAPGTGILIAPAPGPESGVSTVTGPMMVTNEHVGTFKFAAAATGGPAGVTAMTQVAASVLLAGESLEAAMVSPRVHAEAGPRAQVETTASPDAVAALTTRGHEVISVTTPGRVNAASCPPGLPVKPEGMLCRAAADSRGDGVALYPR